MDNSSPKRLGRFHLVPTSTPKAARLLQDSFRPHFVICRHPPVSITLFLNGLGTYPERPCLLLLSTSCMSGLPTHLCPCHLAQAAHLLIWLFSVLLRAGTQSPWLPLRFAHSQELHTLSIPKKWYGRRAETTERWERFIWQPELLTIAGSPLRKRHEHQRFLEARSAALGAGCRLLPRTGPGSAE